MLEIAVCDDDIADLECAVNMLHKIFTSQKIAYHIEKFMSANQMLENISRIDIGILDISTRLSATQWRSATPAKRSKITMIP